MTPLPLSSHLSSPHPTSNHFPLNSSSSPPQDNVHVPNVSRGGTGAPGGPGGPARQHPACQGLPDPEAASTEDLQWLSGVQLVRDVRGRAGVRPLPRVVVRGMRACPPDPGAAGHHPTEGEVGYRQGHPLLQDRGR